MGWCDEGSHDSTYEEDLGWCDEGSHDGTYEEDVV